MIELNNISYQIKQKNILQNVSASFAPGELNVILGPNGSGKSTLIKVLSGLIQKYTGEVKYQGKLLQDYSQKELSVKRSVLLQDTQVTLPFKVLDVVKMGRYPHLKSNKLTHFDMEICDKAMKKLEVNSLKNRAYTTLSGGEKQRVQFARVLSQLTTNNDTPNGILILDEPTNNLDIKHQTQILAVAKKFAQQGNTVICVLHDLNLAMEFADHILFLKKGQKVNEGKPQDIINKNVLEHIYEVNIEILKQGNTTFIKQGIFYEKTHINY